MYYLFIILNKLQINYWFSGQKFFWKINDVWVIFSKCILDTEKRASSERL